MKQHEKEVYKLSQDFKIRNKVLSQLVWKLYHKQIKLHNKTEKEIWKIIYEFDKEKEFLKNERKI